MGAIINIITKKILSISVVCVLFTFVCYSQTNTTDIDANSQVIDEETSFIITDTTVLSTQEGATIEEAEGESIIWLFVRMIFALIVVVGIIYGIVYILKRGFVSKESENPFLKKAATLTLAPGKTVQVITMPDKAWLVGVTDAGINLIGEITDADLVNQMILEAEKTPLSTPRDFATILGSFTHTAKKTEDILRVQRERLRKGNSNE